MKATFLNLLRAKLNKAHTYFPSTVYVEVTNLCNARCIMCPTGRGLISRPKGFMSWGTFKRIIDECVEFEGDGLDINLHLHGEPLLDPLLSDRVFLIKNLLRKSKVNINTNGVLLNEDKAKRLIESGIDQIIFSVNGAAAESYEQICKGLKYSMLEDNLNRYFSIRGQVGHKPYTILQMLVCDSNRHEIEAFKKLWFNKADEIHIKAMHNFLDMNTSIKTKTLSNIQIYKCCQPYNFLIIYWNGDVGLCCWDYDNYAKLGNFKSDSLLDIYNNNNFKRVRHAMDKMDCTNIIPCNRCSQIYGEDMDVILEAIKCPTV